GPVPAALTSAITVHFRQRGHHLLAGSAVNTVSPGHLPGPSGKGDEQDTKCSERYWPWLGSSRGAQPRQLRETSRGPTRAEMRFCSYAARHCPARDRRIQRTHAKPRSQGERANAQLKTWHISHKLQLPCQPCQAGQLTKATHVLPACEITR